MSGPDPIDPRLAGALPRELARQIALAALRMRDDRARVTPTVRRGVAALEAFLDTQHHKSYVVVAFGSNLLWAVVKHVTLGARDRHALWPSPRGYTVLYSIDADMWRPMHTYASWQDAIDYVINEAPLRRVLERPRRSRVRMHVVAGAPAPTRPGYARRATIHPAGLLTDLGRVALEYAHRVFA